MRLSRTLAVAGLFTSAALMLAACAPAGSTASPGTGSGSGNTTAAAPAGAGGTISFQLYQKPTGFSPFHSTHGADAQVTALQFQPLLTYADGEFVPRLAKSWESPDAKTFTIVLNDAKWSDDKPITADDVAYTLNTYLAPSTASVTAGALTGIDGATALKTGAESLSGVKVVDPKTVTITLTNPNAGFLAALAEVYIVPKHIYGEIPNEQLKGNEAFRSPKVGSGPYLFSKWVTDDAIEYTKNTKALNPGKVDKVITKYLSGDVAIAQLKTGEVDIAEVPAAEADRLKNEGMTIVSHDGNKVMTLWTSMDTKKLVDKRVRQAIMYAIDREAIVQSVLGGQGRVVNSIMFEPDWVQNADENKYPYDPEKAKSLLKEADWKADTEVRLDVVPGQADRDAVVAIIVGQLKAVGINAVIKQWQPAELTEQVNKRNLDLLISPLTLSVPEPAMLNPRFLCEQTEVGGINLTGYCSAELDQMLIEAASTTDQAKRAPLYQKINKQLNEDMPQFPLYVANLTSGTTKTIKGFDNRIWPSTVTADRWTK